MKRLAQRQALDWDAGDEDYLREQIRRIRSSKTPGRSRAERPASSSAQLRLSDTPPFP